MQYHRSYLEVLVKTCMLALVTGGALALGMAATHAKEASEVMLKPGDPAPPFTLAGSDGKTHSLADLKGRAVVISWFPKAFTTGCTIECKSLKESGALIRQFDVAYFAASVDDAETNRKFAESLEVDFPILSDPGKDVARAYGVVTAERAVAHRWTFYIGPDGNILAVDRNVEPAKAAENIAARLQELGVKKRTS